MGELHEYSFCGILCRVTANPTAALWPVAGRSSHLPITLQILTGNTMKCTMLVPFLFCISGAPALAQDSLSIPFRDPALPLEKRVEDLVGRMTLPEKIGQMQYDAPAIPRLGVPAYNWWNECLHGVARNGIATVFPQAIGMAATWNPELIHREADVISTEARAKHNEAVTRRTEGIYTGLTFWSPNINMFRDPRWGRGQETYGEDPYLTSRIGVAFVRGLQGDNPRYFKVISTPKHFAVHSGPEPLRHQFDARTSKRDLFETYLPAFAATVTEGGAWSVMGAYNRYMGEPCCASDLLLKTILRGRWAFAGYVVSDCGAITDILKGHKVVQTMDQAAAMAVKAGCDLTCGDEYESLLNAVAGGLITEQDINRSVSRLMFARFRLGMFDPPGLDPYDTISMSMNDTPAHDSLARHVARESIVLLKNGNQALPLRRDLSSIAVLGPNADNLDVLLGNYEGTPSRPVTILKGIRNAVGKETQVFFSRGCELAEGIPPQLHPIPSRNLLTVQNDLSAEGLTGLYYDNMNLDGTPVMRRVDSEVAFSWGADAPAAGLPKDRFSVRWVGTLIADTTGVYRLGVTVDDGFRLTIDGSVFLEDWHDGSTRSYEKDISLIAGEPHRIRLEYYENGGNATVQLGWKLKGDDPLKEALDVAREAEQIILVLGLSPRLEGEEMDVEYPGFLGGDRTDIALPESQRRLMEQVYDLGKPTVLVLLNGGALAVPWAEDHIPAIVEAWYPGEEGGNAVADVLFGDYNPAGRLPVTFYQSVHDLPPFESYDMKGRTYRYFRGKPLYPFGYGLSYSTFAYAPVTPGEFQVGKADTIRMRLQVTNTGARDGDEVVQVYEKGPSQGPAEPIQSLRWFERVHIRAGESRPVAVAIPVSAFQVFNEQTNEFEIVPGTHELLIGSSSSDVRRRVRVSVVP
jgi:beta-glucosidase